MALHKADERILTPTGPFLVGPAPFQGEVTDPRRIFFANKGLSLKTAVIVKTDLRVRRDASSLGKVGGMVL